MIANRRCMGAVPRLRRLEFIKEVLSMNWERAVGTLFRRGVCEDAPDCDSEVVRPVGAFVTSIFRLADPSISPCRGRQRLIRSKAPAVRYHPVTSMNEVSSPQTPRSTGLDSVCVLAACLLHWNLVGLELMVFIQSESGLHFPSTHLSHTSPPHIVCSQWTLCRTLRSLKNSWISSRQLEQKATSLLQPSP